MSIRLDSIRSSNLTLDASSLYDNPEQCVVLNFGAERVFYTLGFDLHAPGTVLLNALSYMFWYRFTDRGMLLGYIINPGGTSIQIPTTTSMYYIVKSFNFNLYQLKIYLQCMDHELYNKNHLPYFYDYTSHTGDDAFERALILDQLSTIQVKAFHELSTASFMLLPYTFFNTYKFDFEHTMYNDDGTLKSDSTYHPVMFTDGGKLNPDFDFHG